MKILDEIIIGYPLFIAIMIHLYKATQLNQIKEHNTPRQLKLFKVGIFLFGIMFIISFLIGFYSTIDLSEKKIKINSILYMFWLSTICWTYFIQYLYLKIILKETSYKSFNGFRILVYIVALIISIIYNIFPLITNIESLKITFTTFNNCFTTFIIIDVLFDLYMSKKVTSK